MTTPVKPIELSVEDQKRILHWARLGAIAEIEIAEVELARHMLLDPDASVLNKYGGSSTRSQRIEHLKSWLDRYHTTLTQLLAVEKQFNDVQMERDAKDIVSSVLAMRGRPTKVVNK